MAKDEKSDVQEKLINVRNYSMDEIWQKFVIPAADKSYTLKDLFSVFIPTFAVFEGVPLEDAFQYISKTENLEKWCATLQKTRPFRDDIYEIQDAASPSGRVYIATRADASNKTIEWLSGEEPDERFILFKGFLVDAELALGVKGSAFIWVNFFHERFKESPEHDKIFRYMYWVHNIEINNLKMILEERYGGKI